MYNMKLAYEQLNYKSTDFLNYISELDVFRHYLGNFRLGSVIKSPFREDKQPSFGVYPTKESGKLVYHDFSTNEYGGVIDFVRKIENMGFAEAINKIKGIVGRNTTYTRPSYATVHNKIGIVRQQFTETDTKYWDSIFIQSSTLKKFNVFSISHYLFNGLVKGVYRISSPMFAYKINNSFKIYRPFDVIQKWRTNCTIRDIQGYEQLPDQGDLLVVTKSLKDVMVLYELGYSAIAPNSESAIIPDDIMEELSKRFKTIIIFFDNDEAGQKGSNNFIEHFDELNLRNFFIDLKYEVKDISDFIQRYKFEETQKFLRDAFKE